VGMFKPVPLILCIIGLGFGFIGVKSWLEERRADPAPGSAHREDVS
jgi:hypothetical protein